MHKPKEREPAVSPGPTYMSNHQMSSYLQDLRNNRPSRPAGTRPVGSRPPPAHFSTWSSRSAVKFADSPVQSSFAEPTIDVLSGSEPAPDQKPASDPRAHRRTNSNMSIDEILAGYGGRALVQPPKGRDITIASFTQERTPSMQYREDGRRQVEREEARDVRMAMEELHFKEEEQLYTAARDEAAELVWKHRNPNSSEKDPKAPYAYPGLKGAAGHQRSRSLGRGETDIPDLQRSHSRLRKRSSIGSSASGSRSSSLQSQRSTSESSVTANAGFSTSPTKKTFQDEKSGPKPDISSAHTDSKQRRQSSGSKRRVSGSLFKNPNDQIYEEPEEEAPAAAATVPTDKTPRPQPPAKLPLQMRRNPFSRVQFARNNSLVRSQTDPTFGTKRFDRYEIQKNPPSQSRNAAYTSNPILTAVAKSEDAAKSDAENDPEIKLKDGKEVRSEDIRAATGFRLKDRSQKLPTPTMVSDSPGRPIVSFQVDWKPKEVELKEERSSHPSSTPKPIAQAPNPPRPLSKAATAPIIPTLNMADDTPAEVRDISVTPLPHFNDPSPSSAPSSKVSRTETPSISVEEGSAPRKLPNTNTTRKVYTPPQTAAPPLPTINVSQAPTARSQPPPPPTIPTISIQETPSISVTPVDRGVKAASIAAAPSIPIISVDGPPASRETPTVSVTPSVPAINVKTPSSTRPLPNPKSHAGKSFPRNNVINQRSHWTPTTYRTGALCAQCALPISGRIVSAAGSRFHPECFLCHHCGEHLECVAFYPEPDIKRAERIVRIRARLQGEDIEFLPSHPTHEDMLRLEQEDGDEGARFFCHLDFHELFSPRCKSCKTPIEGEVIVACGAEWHAGHFFCAQCGDPFDSTTPFVEKDGYAWCVGCHTNRFSTKCRKCRKPVTDTVVKALGKEWHVGCFCCVECSGPFEDGRYFLRDESEDPVCVKCEEKRLKA